jgi:4-alpha-glucanotransferase
MPNEGDADFPAAIKAKAPLLRKAAQAALKDAGLAAEIKEFRAANAWIEESALFDCIKRQPGFDKCAWWEWEPKVRDRDAATLKELRSQHAADADIFIATQFLFDTQWKAVKVRSTNPIMRLAL